MAPSMKVLTAALRAAVKQLFQDDPNSVTVNKVRKAAAENLALDEDFFKSEAWKGKSKDIITTYTDELMEGESSAKPTPVKKEPTPVAKKGKKRASTSQNSGPVKRRKKEETPELSDEASLSEPESEVSDGPKISKSKRVNNASKKNMKQKVESDLESVKDEESEEEVKSKTRPVVESKERKPGKRSLQGSVGPKLESIEDPVKDEDSDDDKGAIGLHPASQDGVKSEDEDSKPRLGKRPKAKVKKQEDSESDLSDLPDEKPKSKGEKSIKVEIKKRVETESELSDVKDETPEPKSLKSPKGKKEEDDESEMSDVIDEEPKPKRQRKSKSEMAAAKANSKSATSNKVKTKAKAKAGPADLTPEEAELKTLQSQLVKCGIKKIWGIYLRQFGDDSKAKIRHLKEMLKDAGMTGRFSNEKAAEIKEARELAADLEAVKEGEEKWGMGSGRRRSVKSGKYKIEEGEDDENGDVDGKGSDSDASEKGNNSRSTKSGSEKLSVQARRKQDLAFLGSEDEDSD